MSDDDAAKDWNPEAYARFRGLRLRPALDLLMQVGALPRGDVIDLGCGDGAVGSDLALRFPGRRLVGVDSSAAMLAEADNIGVYAQLDQADIALWSSHGSAALIFSNAALHWLPDHGTLLPRLIGLLAPGGTLAAQMPRQQTAPSHSLLREVAAQLFPDRFDFTDWQLQVSDPDVYAALLSPLGTVNLWETTYFQRLDPVLQGHPVRHFTASTAMRPIADCLTPDEQTTFLAAYDAALTTPYPLAPDGAVMFPFQRLFFTLARPE